MRSRKKTPSLLAILTKAGPLLNLRWWPNLPLKMIQSKGRTLTCLRISYHLLLKGYLHIHLLLVRGDLELQPDLVPEAQLTAKVPVLSTVLCNVKRGRERSSLGMKASETDLPLLPVDPGRMQDGPVHSLVQSHAHRLPVRCLPVLVLHVLDRAHQHGLIHSTPARKEPLPEVLEKTKATGLGINSLTSMI